MSEGEPRIYRATYSNTEVYECLMNESPIMRRCKDDWVNATQILKCCSFPKAKRTKILEKGVQTGLHEKIQGGFGRFQGTWIPLPDARRLAATYGVTEDQAPVLFLDSSDPNLDIPRKQKPNAKDPTPVKRKYVKKKNKIETPIKKYKSDMDPQIQMQTNHQEYVNQSLQYQMNNQMNAKLNGQLNGQAHNPMPNMNYQVPPSRQDFSMNRSDKILDYNYQLMQQQILHEQQQQQQLYGKAQPPQFHSLPYPVNQPVMAMHNRLSSSQSTNETNWSQDDIARNKESDTSISSTEDKPKSQQLNTRYIDNITGDIMMNSKMEDGTYASQLLKFFSDDTSEIPYFIYNPPFDFNPNEPIDDEGHTPLHWAASIGNYAMIRLLLSKGASPLVVNNFGLNPLSKLISFNNCYELKNFPKVLDDLELCLINTDINGRTPLHYLCQFAKVKSKYDSLRYYLNIIISKLTTMSNQNPSKEVDLLRNVLDHQDVNGDTCLLLAAKSGSAKVVRFLLSYGARDDLENINKETAKMILTNNCILPDYVQQQEQLWQQLSYQQQNAIQFGQELPQQFVQPQMETLNGASNYPQALETPVQAVFRNGSTVETPDTQRTAIQDDDMEDDSNVARVDETHLDNLSDNKENIFMDGKTYEVSTPISKGSNNLHPLGVILENSGANTSESDKKPAYSSVQQFSKPCPPKLDSEGRIITDKVKKLPMHDLSSMICTMINSLSDSHTQDLHKLEEDCKKIEQQLEEKQNIDKETLQRFKKILSNVGLPDFNTVEEGKQLLASEVANLASQVKKGESMLLRVLERNQAHQLSSIIKELESEQKDPNEDSDAEQSWKYAVELTKLQQERTNLTSKLTKSMKDFAIDSKMYKYRKLISSSCGLKVEDIDGLIDGIKESLVESMP